MAVTILTPAQKQILAILAKDEVFQKHFYLSGGTALSEYYLLEKFARIKFDSVIDPIQLGSQLIKVEMVKDLPRMIKKIKKDQWQSYFMQLSAPRAFAYKNLFRFESKTDIILTQTWQISEARLCNHTPNYFICRTIKVNTCHCFIW